MIRVVHIQWVDAAGRPGWHDKSQLKEALDDEVSLCDSVGMLLERTNADKVTLIQTFGTSEVSGVFEIPKDCIRSVRTICPLPLTI